MDLPLLNGYGAGAMFAWRYGRAISVDGYLSDVAQVAALLPQRRHVLNLCTDRYRFAVALGAALVRGQVSLLPPNQAPDLVERLAARYPGLYALGDPGLVEPAMQGGPPASVIETVVFLEQADSQRDSQRTAMPVPALAATQAGVIVFTSGSTGEPVAHEKSWGSLVGSARAEIERLGVSGLSLLGTVPAQHVYGLESTVLMAMQGGSALHAGRPFYPADIRAALEELPRPRGLVTTPVHLRVLLAEPEAMPVADFLLCATAPLSPQLAAEAEARFAAPLHEIYGCTEAGQIASRRTVETDEWRALRGLELRADDRGTWVGGGHVEQEVLLGDVIELRGRSRFLLHGRTADLVNIAGKRTSLAHLNYHLNSIEGVRDGAFVMPDEEGEGVLRLMAFVVAPGVERAAILDALRRRIDPAFLPRPLCFVDALPRNATGKLPRQALDELARKAG
jgi:acyl-coenzyme A synthetase/AMP-(fatty) acid ligase